MGHKTTPKRHKLSLLKRKGIKEDKLLQLVDYINSQIIAKGPADSEGTKDYKGLGQSSELTMGMLEILNDIYANPAKVGPRDLVDWFMTNGGKEPRRRYQAEVVNHFCHSSELQDLQSSSSHLSSKRSCLIDDRTSNGIVSTRLGQRKPLTSHEMYSRLLEKRFHEPPSNGGPKRPNTDRRLVFIMNPDSHALVGVMATAPRYQKNALIHFLFSYIASQPYIGVLSKPQGLVTYELSFHLPFYSWKLTHREPRDIRLRRDGSPLRKVEDMSCLRGDSPKAPAMDYLCQAQIAVDEFDFALASKESQEPLAWLRHARRKLIELVVCLETTIDCWDNFTYPDHMQTRYGRQSMVSIEQTFAEVRNCLKELYNIRTLCDEHERTLNLHNIDEQYRISRMQAQVAENTQVLSCFLLYVVSPITLAAAILSMQEEAIPDFLGPTKLSFFLLTPMLILLVSLVARLVQHWDKVQLYMSHPGNWVQARKRDVNIGIV
ncbi:hypothetical protein FGADI_11744 [Fusarium gaditjirri]|uniref:Uncharacterized protein n=1 Tax=Fusarium gaditjirri TaxID=282569 RepID=A0A8H4WPW5_9HYPO|nr:hypothetical protein FGADI_11744 [Fusarium gaditjirri]